MAKKQGKVNGEPEIAGDGQAALEEKPNAKARKKKAEDTVEVVAPEVTELESAKASPAKKAAKKATKKSALSQPVDADPEQSNLFAQDEPGAIVDAPAELPKIYKNKDQEGQAGG